MTSPSITRRRILAAAGGVGALYLGSERVGAVLGTDRVEPNQRSVNGTYAQPSEFTDAAPPPIALDWRETLNGAVQEETELATDGDTGDVGLIVDEGVVPGDSGAVTMRARLLERDQDTASAELFLRFRLETSGENGISDPERAAGDGSLPGTLDDGELDDVARIRIWKDESAFGTGDGELTWDDVPIVGDEELTDGWQSLSDVAESGTFADGYRISTCLDPADDPAVYVSFEWEIPESLPGGAPGENINVIQGDTATFQVGFDPRPCGGS
jgi:hypothetical protein